MTFSSSIENRLKIVSELQRGRLKEALELVQVLLEDEENSLLMEMKE